MLAALKFFLGQDEAEDVNLDDEEDGGGSRNQETGATPPPSAPSAKDVYSAKNKVGRLRQNLGYHKSSSACWNIRKPCEARYWLPGRVPPLLCVLSCYMAAFAEARFLEPHFHWCPHQQPYACICYRARTPASARRL